MARAFEKKGDLGGAESGYRALLAQDPKDPRVNFGLGKVLEKKGSNQDALGFYRAAYTSDPTNQSYRDAYERMVAITVNVNANINVNVNQPPQPTGTAYVHIYRPSKFVGSLAVMTLTMDGRPIARLGNGRHFTIKVPLGSHYFGGDRVQPFTAVATKDGQEFFLSLELGMFQITFEPREPNRGLREFNGTKPIENDRIYDREAIVEGGAGGAPPPGSSGGGILGKKPPR
jgi:tetratricopeptide (TPR) repeat protein